MTTLTTAEGTGNTTTASPTRPRSQLGRLYRSELRLLRRETQGMLFVFAFPALLVLVLGGVFGDETDDPGFEFISPSQWYVAAYFGVTLAAIGLIMLPQHIAAYRESGVLRRFRVAGFAPWAFPVSQILIGLTFTALGFGALIATAWLSYGLPEIDDLGRTLAGLGVGTAAFISIGVALGMLLPSAQAAGSIGLAGFFPMFLLSGGGPPPEAMPSVMRTIADYLPLTHVIRAIQEPWLAIASGTNHLLIGIGVTVVATAAWLRAAGHVTEAA